MNPTSTLSFVTFNVGRGLAHFIRLPDPFRCGLLFDLGASEEFSPTEFLSTEVIPDLLPFDEGGEGGIAQLFISHPHLDHIKEMPAIWSKQNPKGRIAPGLLTCPHDKDEPGYEAERVDFSRVINPGGDDLVALYRSSYRARRLPLQLLRHTTKRCGQDLNLALFFMNPVACARLHTQDQDYANGISLVLWIRYGNATILLTGDVTPEVLEKMLSGHKDVQSRFTSLGPPASLLREQSHSQSIRENPSLGQLLLKHGLTFFVAPHHGLESCFQPRLYDHIGGANKHRAALHVISESRRVHENHGSTAAQYQSEDYATGMAVEVDGSSEHRYSVSTKNQHHVGISVSPEAGARVVLSRSADKIKKLVLAG